MSITRETKRIVDEVVTSFSIKLADTRNTWYRPVVGVNELARGVVSLDWFDNYMSATKGCYNVASVEVAVALKSRNMTGQLI